MHSYCSNGLTDDITNVAMGVEDVRIICEGNCEAHYVNAIKNIRTKYYLPCTVTGGM